MEYCSPADNLLFFCHDSFVTGMKMNPTLISPLEVTAQLQSVKPHCSWHTAF
uniref:Uncharacterized protein n=1 Tax=Anguilla anguilla TaxID=7936 RepID=A0A0E9XHD0_ANGAN